MLGPGGSARHTGRKEMSGLRMPESRRPSPTHAGLSTAPVTSFPAALCSPLLPKQPCRRPELRQSFFGGLLERLFCEAGPDHHGRVGLPTRVTTGRGHASIGAPPSWDRLPVCHLHCHLQRA